MSKSFTDGAVVPLHTHERDQLLYAIRGTMRLRTEHEAWVVPPDIAMHIPAGTPHSVSMHGTVDMRTLYIDTQSTPMQPKSLCMVSVSRLLRELILALSEEPVEYKGDDRSELIAKLIELEMDRSQNLTMRVPLPQDPRLQRLCAALLADPSDGRTLERWSEIAGASPRTLARLFEKDLGMSFNKWRQRSRFHSALEHLSEGNSIAEVAHRHGYKSTSAFTAAFRKEMGFVPSQRLGKSAGTGS